MAMLEDGGRESSSHKPAILWSHQKLPEARMILPCSLQRGVAFRTAERVNVCCKLCQVHAQLGSQHWKEETGQRRGEGVLLAEPRGQELNCRERLERQEEERS